MMKKSGFLNSEGDPNNHRFIGRRYDGNKSPLGGKVELGEYGAAFPAGATGGGKPYDIRGTMADALLHASDKHTVVISESKPSLQIPVGDLKRVLLERFDLTPAKFAELPRNRQNHFHQKVVRVLRAEYQHLDVVEQMLRGTPDKTAPGVHTARGSGESIEATHRGGLPRTFLEHGVSDAAKAERTELHQQLRGWAASDLRLEHPQGSSFHHVVDYDDKHSPGEWKARLEITGPPHLFVVERDWARAFAGYDLTQGEAPLPFPHCCFEFRISGVRVLAFYHEDYMFCVYGRGGVWVCDDYNYDLPSGTARKMKLDINHHEFPRVNRLVQDNVRVACIMVDADLARREHVPVSRKLVERRTDEGRAAPRSHYVIDLKRQRHVNHGATGGGVSGVKQRGHFRRGTWVHYDDLDSGAVQYADSGGFWHSRTWRAWHFAGDPDNLVEKEYRL